MLSNSEDVECQKKGAFMRVRSIMKQNLATVSPDTSLGAALQTMLWATVRHLPVMEGEHLVGILSERDYLRYLSQHGAGAEDAPVALAMTASPHTVSPDELVEVVAQRLATEKVGCLPVVQRGKLLGLVTTTDVLVSAGQKNFSEATHGETSGATRGLTAADVMTKRPVTLRDNDVLGHAVFVFVEHRVRHLPVVDGNNRILGLLEDRLIRPERGSEWSRMPVKALMDRNPQVVAPDASFVSLAAMFADWRLPAVLVGDPEGHLMGIISYVDLLRHAVD